MLSKSLKKYDIQIIDKIDDLKTVKNLSYFKNRADHINEHVHEHLIQQPSETIEIDGIQYWVGLEIVCKKHFDTKDATFHVNYSYVIDYICEEHNYFIIRDEDEDEAYKIILKKTNHKGVRKCTLTEYFKLPYCSTVHSAQGDTIDDKITIFDCNSPYVDRNYVWTALTRVKRLDDVTIFKHSDQEIKSLNYCKVHQYFKLKVLGYKQQDRIAKRTYDENEYVTHNELWDQFKEQKVCTYCKEPLYIYLNKQNNINSNITLDRKDNTLFHSKQNCVLCCKSCNITKK